MIFDYITIDNTKLPCYWVCSEIFRISLLWCTEKHPPPSTGKEQRRQSCFVSGPSKARGEVFVPPYHSQSWRREQQEGLSPLLQIKVLSFYLKETELRTEEITGIVQLWWIKSNTALPPLTAEHTHTLQLAAHLQKKKQCWHMRNREQAIFPFTATLLTVAYLGIQMEENWS